MKLLKSALFIGFLACGSVSQAYADQMQIVYTGTVQGNDFSGLFGSPTYFDGAAFQATYVFDTSTPGAYLESDNYFSTIYKGSLTPSPALSAVLTINGISFSLGGNFLQAQDYVANYPGSYKQYNVVTNTNYEGLSNYFYGYGDYSVIPTSINTSYSSSLPLPNPYFSYGNFSAQGESLTLNNESVAVNTVAAVPEPKTYAMLLAGLGLLGFAARRRHCAPGLPASPCYINWPK